ncbi:MAG TPA: D-alanyl-D-alanine carboxypeptidase/D-alanyl-D-alanine-endopeptidase [Bacteroidia bacterium]|nr:D-alanyl-D-alanine carboxypeptidase/D-alanyl-D-alanine-endopeptidase [Bacteroidia bacterium]HRS58847.1 D-alanyl-D-alanine carboxypeptidase/D-alanyl-D-alanine-endopeptidase [Bacteroidia bacterium]HRU67721.1 D-alanyl-D-alanine carboxypeptidase/D-alanyl-D-alanine-endopeptidase [Bacteroidia bacterium]
MKKIVAAIIILFCFFFSGNHILAPDNNSQKERLSPRDKFEYSADLQSVINDFAAQGKLENASIGISIYDLSSASFIAEYNPVVSLVPASVMKIITTAAALELLGKDTVFNTEIYYSGSINPQSKVLTGDLIIRGGGDPCLGSQAFKNYYYQPDFLEKWAEAVKNAGIEHITGNIIADASVFDDENVPSNWNWVDIPAYYGTPAFGLSVYDNQFVLNFSPKRKGRYKVHPDSMNPVIPDLYVENRIRADTKEEKYLDFVGVYYSNQRIIKGNLSKISGTLELKGSIPDPPYLIGYQLRTKLQEKGISITGDVVTSRMYLAENKPLPAEKKLICTTNSPTLAEIVRRTNMFSINLYAEHLLNHIGYFKSGLGSTKAGVKSILSYYESKGYDTKGVNICDGSGLSRNNTLTARFIVKVLAGMSGNKPVQEAFYQSLPVSGSSGTLRSFCNGTVAEGKIHAKSGTMSRVKCYAGYMEVKSGKTIAFAVMVNNFSTGSDTVNALLAQLMVNIYNNY